MIFLMFDVFVFHKFSQNVVTSFLAERRAEVSVIITNWEICSIIFLLIHFYYVIKLYIQTKIKPYF